MVIEINGKNYVLDFGVGFMKYIERNTGGVLNTGNINYGRKFGGFEFTYELFKDGDVESLTYIIRGGLITQNNQPSNEELDAFIQELEDGEYQALLEDSDELPLTNFINEVDEGLKGQSKTGIRILKLEKSKQKNKKKQANQA